MEHHLAQVFYPTWLQFALLNQIVYQFRMMYNFKLSTVLEIVILQGAIAMWALGDYFLDALLFEHLYVVFSHSIENELIAQTTQAVATAHLILA